MCTLADGTLVSIAYYFVSLSTRQRRRRHPWVPTLEGWPAAIISWVTNWFFAAPPPFDEATLRTSVDDLTGSIATQAQAGGGTTVTTVKNKKRDVLDGLLRKLAHYVQANCNDDVQVVLNSGFQAKTTAVRSQVPLEKAKIVSVDNGHAKELVVRAHKIPRARSYEVQAAAVGANNTVGSFQPAGIFTKSRSMTVTGLTPGTTYAFQVRALGRLGYTDWSDSANRMSM